MTFTIKQNDTSPALTSQLRDSNVPINLSGFQSVSFRMEDKFQRVVIDDDTSGNVIVTDPENGIVEYQFDESETTQVGRYNAEWVVQFDDGSVETFPSTNYITIEIVEEIA